MNTWEYAQMPKRFITQSNNGDAAMSSPPEVGTTPEHTIPLPELFFREAHAHASLYLDAETIPFRSKDDVVIAIRGWEDP